MQVRLNQKAAEASGNACHHCAKPINLDTARHLEMDTRTGYMHIGEAPIPEEFSQGWFPIGSTCYAKLLKQSQKRYA